MLGYQAASGPNHDGRSVSLALLAVPLLPVHPKAYWYGPILNSRNVAMALGPVLPAAFAQIAFLQLVLVLSLSVTMVVLAWRVKGANVIDFACHVCFLAMVLLATFFAGDKYLAEVANL